MSFLALLLLLRVTAQQEFIIQGKRLHLDEKSELFKRLQEFELECMVSTGAIISSPGIIISSPGLVALAIPLHAPATRP